jgi:hypothetical protein
MEYTVRFKLTSDLTPEDWDAYVKAFNDVFNKDYTVEQLKSKYTGTCWGYSMHGLLYVEDLLVGGQTFMPQKVNYKGREILLANGCDSFTLKDYRDDPMAMMKARKPAYEYMKAHGVSGTFGSTYKAFVKYLTHFLGVKVIFGKYNCFTKFFTIFNSNSVCHKSIEHLADCVTVKNPLIERR